MPSIYLCFYTLTSDPTLATLHDNQLKSDINAIKITIQKSGYKTRVAVALMSDYMAIPQASLDSTIQERLENIRKGTGLDTGRTIFYVAPRENSEGLTDAGDTILTALYAQSVEYYRELGRRARKKRGRGVIAPPTIPPTTGTSQTLSLPGWYVRYDFKAGVFAEYRQEMDSAIRSYETAYEGLHSQDVWDIIPSWSPRWNEARLLSDLIAIRILRCYLWNDQTSLAVSRWQAHRDRIADFIDRRGRGTSNYGWKAWEARWSLVMANLIERTDIRGFDASEGALFLQPEKAAAAEHLFPWCLMHHTGYWYRQAARHIAGRRAFALTMPEEDRQSPDSSPLTNVTNKAYTYDTYMCPEPHQELPIGKPGANYSQLILDCLRIARSQFHKMGQHRQVAEISLDCAREAANLGQWEDVVALLRPLWEDMPFRVQEWLDITEELGWMLRAAASKTNLGDVILAIDWELLHRSKFSYPLISRRVLTLVEFTRRRNWHYDIAKSLQGVGLGLVPHVRITDDASSSFITASFVFRSEGGKAGETSLAQLALKSDAFPDSAPIPISDLKLDFDGRLRPIILTHDSSAECTDAERNIKFSTIALKEEALQEEDETQDLKPTIGKADLLLGPGQTKVYEMAILLREPGEAKASSVKISVKTEHFRLDYGISFHKDAPRRFWLSATGSKKKIGRENSHVINVEARPPKMDIILSRHRDQYYSNEGIDLELELVNAEEDDAVAKLDIHVFGDRVPGGKVQVSDLPEVSSLPNVEASKVATIAVGIIKNAGNVPIRISLDAVSSPTSLDIAVRVSYHLVSDPVTPIIQKKTFQVTVSNAFEANYDLLPRLHLEAWPSLFDAGTIQDVSNDAQTPLPPLGLAQKWCLICHYASFATEDLQIVDVEAQIASSIGGARCTANKPTFPSEGLRVAPRTMQEANFDIFAHKISLDDRGPASVDLAFLIKWKRLESDTVNTTTMFIPRYYILGTEPRVLASLSPLGEDGLVNLDITIENASSHFLTFGLSMEPSDEFAFSGSKKTTVHVLPVSRRTATYSLLPLVTGAFIRPGLVVKDKYYQKTLRIIPTEGMKIDKDGLLVWIPGEVGEIDDEVEKVSEK